MEGTGLFQGSFVSTGTTTIVKVPSGADWIETFNYTKIAANALSTGYEFKWQFGMPMGSAIETISNAGGTGTDMTVITSGGFSIYNPQLQLYGPIDNGSTQITAVSTGVLNTSSPVVTTGSTAGMFAGDVVRLYDIAGAAQLGGMEFTIGYAELTGTTFSLDYAPNVIVAGTTGHFYVVNYPPLFVPRALSITAITKAAQAVVRLSVQHNYKVGQEIRMVVPAAFGMTQMDGLLATIVAVDTATGFGHNTVTINVDSTAFDAFVFPLTAASPFTPAQIIPVGENINAALSNPNLLDDSINNAAFIGMRLGAGTNGPAGVVGDVIYWKAGTSSLGGQ